MNIIEYCNDKFCHNNDEYIVDRYGYLYNKTNIDIIGNYIEANNNNNNNNKILEILTQKLLFDGHKETVNDINKLMEKIIELKLDNLLSILLDKYERNYQNITVNNAAKYMQSYNYMVDPKICKQIICRQVICNMKNYVGEKYDIEDLWIILKSLINSKFDEICAIFIEKFHDKLNFVKNKNHYLSHAFGKMPHVVIQNKMEKTFDLSIKYNLIRIDGLTPEKKSLLIWSIYRESKLAFDLIDKFGDLLEPSYLIDGETCFCYAKKCEDMEFSDNIMKRMIDKFSCTALAEIQEKILIKILNYIEQRNMDDKLINKIKAVVSLKSFISSKNSFIEFLMDLDMDENNKNSLLKTVCNDNNDVNYSIERLKIIEQTKKIGLQCCVCTNIVKEPIIIKPCNHASTCKTCTENIKSCPVCRKNIEKTEKIFF